MDELVAAHTMNRNQDCFKTFLLALARPHAVHAAHMVIFASQFRDSSWVVPDTTALSTVTT